jgi:murein L,D-transpeptidase YcbB/YkuD
LLHGGLLRLGDAPIIGASPRMPACAASSRHAGRVRPADGLTARKPRRPRTPYLAPVPAAAPLLALLLAAVAFAAPAGAGPRWTDAAGRPSAEAREALALLAGAGDDGLDPLDYGAPQLARMAARLHDGTAAPAAQAVEAFEAALARALPRYLRHLHRGRVEPRQAGFRLPAPRDDAAAVEARVQQALDELGPARAAAALAPALPAYRPLRAALARYRVLAADPGLAPWLAIPTVRPGEHSTAMPALRARLRAFGDLPAAAPATAVRATTATAAGEWPAQAAPHDDDLYDASLLEAVRRFQARHGLAADGVLGPATQAALAVSPARRMRQIELSMERLRWLPELPARFVGVNIPMFRLWAVDSDGEPAPLPMKVVVGRALNTRTPVLMAQMRELVFRPYWNVPRSIVRQEILAPLARDPHGYLARHDMEIVHGAGDDARAVAPTPEHIALLRDGTLRLRQRPGPRNALGLLKFVFPNDSDIYLHGTPAQDLFERARRDFSHGCIRVEDPVALAEWLLREQPGWTRERIVRAMQGERTLGVTLARPLPVVLYYVTALASADGTVRFADDLYGHDGRLERALRPG